MSPPNTTTDARRGVELRPGRPVLSRGADDVVDPSPAAPPPTLEDPVAAESLAASVFWSLVVAVGIVTSVVFLGWIALAFVPILLLAVWRLRKRAPAAVRRGR